jgi:hypothetical protein
MRVQYRYSSGAVLLIIVMPLASALLPIEALHRTESNSTSGTWNPCFMWEQVPPLVRISVLVYAVAFIVHLIQGLRNRAAPRWLGIAGLVSLAVTARSQLWRVMGCYSGFDKIAFFLYIAFLGLMFLHHVVQPGDRGRSESASGSASGAR